MKFHLTISLIFTTLLLSAQPLKEKAYILVSATYVEALKLKMGQTIDTVLRSDGFFAYVPESNQVGKNLPGSVSRVLLSHIPTDADLTAAELKQIRDLISTLAAPVAIDSVIIENNLFSFQGTWNHFTNTTTGWSENKASVTTQAGATASYTCSNCRGFKLYSEKYPEHGIMAVSIDGGTEQLINQYNPSRISQRKLFEATFPDGQHTIRVRCTRTKENASQGFYTIIDYLTVISKR